MDWRRVVDVKRGAIVAVAGNATGFQDLNGPDNELHFF
jgi:hypothetical protein